MKSKNYKENFVFLLSRKNNWIENKLSKFLKELPKKYNYTVTKNIKNIINKNVFVLSYTKILKESFLKKNKNVLVIHPSKLPLDRGFSPVQNQILKKQKLIHISMIKAVKEVDTGPICFENSFHLKGHELYDEIRKEQSLATFKIIKKYLTKFPKIKFKEQKGRATFNKRRKFTDNELNINKSLKSQFNLLRIANNEEYPANFKYMNNNYIIKILKK